MAEYNKEFENDHSPEHKLQLLNQICETVKERIQNDLDIELSGRKMFRPWFAQ